MPAASLGGTEPRHLFVYGTLMSAASGPLGSDMRARLARESSSAGAATCPGRLFDLGRYPGLVAAVAGDDRVHGEVLRLADPAATLPWLDEYEGIGVCATTPPEYERRIATVTLAAGDTLSAWIYAYLLPVDGMRQLPAGRWCPAAAEP